MQDILARRNRALIEEFASSNVLLGFDYDGTLAPIVARPERARMRPTTRRLLIEVARHYPCVVISGRTHDDIAGRLKDVPVWQAFGNHGCEPWVQSDTIATVVSEWVQKLRVRFDRWSNIVIEDKTLSVTVHYRHVRNQRLARRAIRGAIADLPRIRAVGGRHAINLLIRGGPDKGVALQQARRALGCKNVVYVGDDETDEDAFASASPSQLLAIRVGVAGRASRAHFRLKTQRDIDRLLEMLLTLRTSGFTMR